MEYKDIKAKLTNLQDGEEVEVYAKESDSIIPPLAMGVRKERFFDGIDVYLCGVYGSGCDFATFPVCIDEYDGDAVDRVIKWLVETSNNLCTKYNGNLSLTNEEEYCEKYF